MTKEFLSKNFFINFVLHLCFSVLSNHTANNYGRLELDSPGYQTAASLQPLTENSRHEKIEVQILPHVSFFFLLFFRKKWIHFPKCHLREACKVSKVIQMQLFDKDVIYSQQKQTNEKKEESNWL